jgi:hypothetical protein
MVTFRVCPKTLVNISVPVRSALVVFLSTVIITVPVPDPLEGSARNQVSLQETDQPAEQSTEQEHVPPDADNEFPVAVTLKTNAFWEMETSFFSAGLSVLAIVTLRARCSSAVLETVVILTLPLPLPLVGEALTQLWPEGTETDHLPEQVTGTSSTSGLVR